ncbi:7614_t:CDS:2, partial [Funneliformis geosporum]
VDEGLLDKHIPSGHRLGSIRELELEKALRGSIKTASDIANDYKVLQDIYLERVKDFNHANTRLEKVLSEKDSLLHEANARIKKHLTNFEKKPSPDSFETQ